VENTVYPENGHHMTLDEVLEQIVEGEDVHCAPTRVVALENTLSGMVFPQDEIERISKAVRAKGIIMHCDGARMWEVMAKTGKSLEELCRPFDTVSLCMSKGLGAPIGSVLVGPADFISQFIRSGLRESSPLTPICASREGNMVQEAVRRWHSTIWTLDRRRFLRTLSTPSPSPPNSRSSFSTRSRSCRPRRADPLACRDQHVVDRP
jgi:hypothetical protein